MAKVSQYKGLNPLVGSTRVLGVQSAETGTLTLDDIAGYAAVEAGAVTLHGVEMLLGADDGADLVGFTQGGAGAITRTLLEKARETVSPLDFGASGDGATDDVDALTKALNARGALSPNHLGPVLVVNGLGLTYAIDSDIQIPTNTQLTNCTVLVRNGAKIKIGKAGDPVHYYSGLPFVKVIGALDGSNKPTSTNLVVIDNAYRFDVRGTYAINSKGAGITCTTTARNGEWGRTYSYNCCQDVSQITGAIEIRGSDHNIFGHVIGQANFSSAEIAAELANPGSTQFQYRVGLLLNMSTSHNGGMLRGEISGLCGIYILNSFSTDFGLLLADQNAGHGVIFANNCANFKADICSSDNNKMGGDYDACRILTGSVSRYDIRSIQVDELGSIGNPMRYHLYVAASTSMADRGSVAHPRGRLNGGARFSIPTAVPPTIVEGRGGYASFADGDTTPSVDGGTGFKFSNTSATSVTTFDDAYEGKNISVIGDGNTTLVHGTIVCPLGKNYTPRNGDVVTLERRNSAWFVTSPIRRLHGNTTQDFTSIATGSSHSFEFTVSGAAVGDIVQITASPALPNGVILTASVSAASTVKLVVGNLSGSAVDLPNTVFRAFVTPQ